jgi:hypothetical protein
VGLKTLLSEIEKLERVRAIGFPGDLFADASERHVAAWRARAAKLYPSDLRAAPDPVRLTLLAALCWTRTAEVTDGQHVGCAEHATRPCTAVRLAARPGQSGRGRGGTTTRPSSHVTRERATKGVAFCRPHDREITAARAGSRTHRHDPEVGADVGTSTSSDTRV